MLISEMLTTLSSIQEKHGDLPVVVESAHVQDVTLHDVMVDRLNSFQASSLNRKKQDRSRFDEGDSVLAIRASYF
ncbi:MAG: hypothetical protein M3Y57_00545 [Acidobacteriota bacterium]|nr:hypothetical protein [Acidobacteriota bacterium]